MTAVFHNLVEKLGAEEGEEGSRSRVVAAFTVIILSELPEEHPFADGVQKVVWHKVSMVWIERFVRKYFVGDEVRPGLCGANIVDGV